MRNVNNYMWGVVVVLNHLRFRGCNPKKPNGSGSGEKPWVGLGRSKGNWPLLAEIIPNHLKLGAKICNTGPLGNKKGVT